MTHCGVMKEASAKPDWADAYEEMGYFYDAVIADPASAEGPFQKAIDLEQEGTAITDWRECWPS